MLHSLVWQCSIEVEDQRDSDRALGAVDYEEEVESSQS